ncbi:MAG: hypothetical protein JO125_06210 [Chloroflexi bacterium]|nr:hypothetical protein [Ktedonobacteraceae bacterium]MBV9019180.1 hypothetical protein [Ktedonobacteraceae bacterium]MBV9706981.1 hypothetical protein [Chloroflexota bacterium]
MYLDTWLQFRQASRTRAREQGEGEPPLLYEVGALAFPMYSSGDLAKRGLARSPS